MCGCGCLNTYTRMCIFVTLRGKRFVCLSYTNSPFNFHHIDNVKRKDEKGEKKLNATEDIVKSICGPIAFNYACVWCELDELFISNGISVAFYCPLLPTTFRYLFNMKYPWYTTIWKYIVITLEPLSKFNISTPKGGSLWTKLKSNILKDGTCPSNKCSSNVPLRWNI